MLLPPNFTNRYDRFYIRRKRIIRLFPRKKVRKKISHPSGWRIAPFVSFAQRSKRPP